MATDDRTIRILEGLGYTSAMMIACAGFTRSEALRLFNIAGLVFGLIAIIRLQAINLRLRLIGLELAQVDVPKPGKTKGEQDATDKEEPVVDALRSRPSESPESPGLPL